jgi:hypothetical protein
MVLSSGAAAGAEPVSLDTARRALEQGDSSRALALYEQLANQTVSGQVELGLIRAAIQAGELRKAMAFADHLAVDHRDVVEGLALGAFLQDRIGRTEVALKQLDVLQAREPAHFAPVAARAEILIDHGLPADALKLLQGWSTRHPNAAKDADLQRLQARADQVAGRAVRTIHPTAASSGAWPAPAFRPFALADARALPAGNGVVVDNGTRILTLSSIAARGSGRFLVRNARGEVRIARRTAVASAGETAHMALEQAYPKAWSVARERMASADGVRFCFAFGFSAPGGPAAYPGFATGILLRQHASEQHVMQITSALTQGHAGSPLFDPYGRLIGLALGASATLANGGTLVDRLGKGQFAVPIPGAMPAPVVRPGEKTPPQPQIELLHEQLSPAIVEIVPLG